MWNNFHNKVISVQCDFIFENMATCSCCVRFLQLVPQRYVVVFMSFIAMVNVMGMRSIIYLVITQMVKPHANAAILKIDDSLCPARETVDIIGNGTAKNETLDAIKYAWSEEVQGWILGAFYIGYVLTQIPGGLLSERFGGKMILVVTQLATAIFTFITPLTVTWGGARALIVLRIILGLLQGGLFPALATVISTWVPPSERAFSGSIIFSGIMIGTILSRSVSGLLLYRYNNWHLVFHLFGGIGAGITLLYIFLTFDSPSTHPFITETEKEMILKEIGQLKRDKNLPAPPWRAILTSRPVIALNITGCLASWGYFVAMIDLPKYMKNVLRMNSQENGIYSSLPYAMFIIVSLSGSYLSDRLITNGSITITNARKLYELSSSIIEGSFVLAAAYAGCDPIIVGTFLTIAVGAQGLQTSGQFVNPIDLSPNYSGTVFALYNGIGCIFGVLVPVFVGLLTPNSLATEWRIVFGITFIVDIIKVFVFTLWGSAKIQPWNNPETTEQQLSSDAVTKDTKTNAP